jgi:hypothetical protein
MAGFDEDPSMLVHPLALRRLPLRIPFRLFLSLLGPSFWLLVSS